MLHNVLSRSRQLRRIVISCKFNLIVCRQAFTSEARPTVLLSRPFRSDFGKAFFHTRTETPYGFVDDTIYALSTAHGRAGIAVIRISGSACLDV